ncbi:MAG: RusA family crossover junction endodeoxyribonuclease [Desulfobacteraceae bacterium]|nr:RusA family crossover junction endodeoxyribonuclease [Desulfobacteraceae bacterium]MBC2748755.1 RusA family crossover junction endodeoxyribonuclease [Desulfobacteraceae bacterium]
MQLSGKKPPLYGQIKFEIDKAPVSLQAKRNKKDDLKEFISKLLEGADYLLTGDVKIEIEWHVHEKKRYETDTSADIDNIIKPLLDSLCGPCGILIDDNQVQCVTCSWLDAYDYAPEKIYIIVNYMDDEFISKEGIIFINIDNSLCLPFNEKNPPKIQKIILNQWLNMFSTKNELISLGLGYYDAQGVMPIQRVFHKSRLNSFNIVDINEKLERLKS